MEKFDIWLVKLDPTHGSEMQKTRPAVIVSPNSINRNLRTVIIAPITNKRREYPTRIPCDNESISGDAALDQIRTVDKQRLVKKLGRIETGDQELITNQLLRMFAE